MIESHILKKQLAYTLSKTNFSLGKKYEGKVRDNYILDGKRLIITTDRISAFDRVLCTLPFKGAVINQTAVYWFEKTKDIVANHLISMPDPNVILAKECTPYSIEVVVRGYLTGVTTTSAWYNYERGVRNFCGNILPEGMAKNQKFQNPILTPSTKAEKGAHDASVDRDYFIKNKLISEDMYEKIERVAYALFARGTELCAKNNLILVDTKYEFGEYNGELYLIDEIHTPDSSRFWIKDTYDALFTEGKEPQKLDKEYVRQYLAEKGFTGHGAIPEIPDDVKIEAARRYITAYEMITGTVFAARVGDVQARMKKNLAAAGLLPLSGSENLNQYNQ